MFSCFLDFNLPPNNDETALGGVRAHLRCSRYGMVGTTSSSRLCGWEGSDVYPLQLGWVGTLPDDTSRFMFYFLASSFSGKVGI
jgi:hypothetical protein